MIMARSTFRYPFEARIHAAVLALTGDPAARVLLRFDAAAPEAVRDDAAAAQERQQRGADGRPFLYYDGFDAPDYAFLEWRGVTREMMEQWLGRGFGDTDFKPHQPKDGPADMTLRNFPADWSVIL